MEVAKALGGSFKLVMIVPKTVREMTQLPKETQKNGDLPGISVAYLRYHWICQVNVENSHHSDMKDIKKDTFQFHL